MARLRRHQCAPGRVRRPTATRTSTGTYDEGNTLLTRANLSSSGDQASAAHSGETGVAISGDGRYVCFDSDASNLVSGDTGFADFFVRDRFGFTTVRASVTHTGDQADGTSNQPALSSNGLHVAFASTATNLVPGDTNFDTDVFVRDLSAGTTVRVSLASDGTEANDDSYKPSISADGRYVVFASSASNLVAGDTNNATDLFLHDRDADDDGVYDETHVGARSTTRLSVTPAGEETGGGARMPWISRDGRFVTWKIDADDQIPGDTNFVSDVVVLDRDWDEDGVFDEAGATGQRRLLTWAGVQPTDDVGSFVGARISDDGRYVAVPTLAPFDATDCRTVGRTSSSPTSVRTARRPCTTATRPTTRTRSRTAR